MDVENFKRLFLPLHPKLFRIAYALVENKADAEDILQDAYYKLWSRRNELTDIQNPEAFCVTLVKNLCLDFLRSPRANRRDTDVTEAVYSRRHSAEMVAPVLGQAINMQIFLPYPPDGLYLTKPSWNQ